MAQIDKEAVNGEMRRLPSVEKLLEEALLKPYIDKYSRSLVTTAVQQTLTGLLKQIKEGVTCPDAATIIKKTGLNLEREWGGLLCSVINGSGVILHTNMGRAPLSPLAIKMINKLGGGYTPLEFDLASGDRGHRTIELEKLLCLLGGADSALVVNNNAAAVFLILKALAGGKEVIVSRGELVQIGGGFRLPEIMAQSDVKLVEVGTTNKTYLEDYENAITPQTGLILKVHRSNFALRGFSHEPTVPELAKLAYHKKLPFVYDIGSGAFKDTEKFGLEHEPTIGESINGDADVTCFSGDKLMGGPQAGIILGKKKYLDTIRKHPFMRTVRIGGLVAIALEATLLDYFKNDAASVPVWQMIALSAREIGKRAARVVIKLKQAGIEAEVIAGASMVGGGSLPDQTLPSKLISVNPPASVTQFAKKVRLGSPAVIGRTQEDRFLIDLRTVFPHLDDKLAQAIINAVEKGR